MTDNTQPEAREFTMSQYASKDDMIGAMRKRIAELESELQAVGAGGVQALSAAPAGWKLVPVEPTKEMVAAACREHGYPGGSRAAYVRGYKSMIAASPTPPAEQQATKETSGGFHVWRDISTAPKDGSRFVAIGYNYGLYSEGRHICVAQWFRGCWMETSDWNEASELQHLTHWLPLPSPPDDVAAPAEQQAAPKAAPGEPVAWRISCPNEPDLGFWLAEEDGGEGFLSEPLYTRTAPQAAGQDARPCHVFTVRKAGGLTEWEPTTMALALPDGAHALYTLPQPSPHAQADSVTAPQQEAQEPMAHDEDLLERLYWDFDSQRKKTGEERLAFKGKMRSYASEFRRRSVGQMVFAQSVSDDMMNLADRLGDLPYVDPRAWRHLLVYAPQQAPAPLSDAQIKELIEDGVFLGNCKEIVRAIEQAHGITQKGGKNE